MSDFADDASELEALNIRLALEAQKKYAKEHELALELATGACLNCDEPLDEGRFCDVDCRSDFEKRLKARR